LIQAITFDFWNTLFQVRVGGDARRRLIGQMLEQAGWPGLTDRDVDRAISRAWEEWNRVWVEEHRTFGAEEWVTHLLGELQVELDRPVLAELVQTLQAASGEGPPLVEGVALVLPRLARRYRLGVISDTGLSPGWVLRQWMASNSIVEHFTWLTFSDELGVSKPHPQAFLTTLANLGAQPGTAVHIGDYPRTDIAGAQAIGMRAIRFAGVHDWGDDGVQPDAVIHSYATLEPLLQKWDSD
jgi:FMN hydrolase / 5-amino-6-(5-phospho-D-ribitylamino)uracil phosphatase